MHEPEGTAGYLLLRDQASHARVALMGVDGDALLNESPKPYFRSLLRERRLVRLATGVARYALWQKRVLPRGMLHRRPDVAVEQEPGDQSDLIDVVALLPTPHLAPRNLIRRVHPGPYAHRILRGSIDGPISSIDSIRGDRLAMEVRHPFLDLRLVEYCLGLPPMPWCVKKHILRESLKGVVPDAARRPKTALGGNPGAAPRARRRALGGLVSCGPGAGDTSTGLASLLHGARRTQAAWIDLRPLTLNFWLQQHDTRHLQETHA
jgi:hypothetical protein